MGKDKFSDFERRKFPRFNDKIFIFGNLRVSPTKEFSAVTQNISAGGLMFETERDILNQDKLELEIYQPLGCDKTVIFSIPVLAKVSWTQKIEKDNFNEGENKYRVGMEFLEIGEGDRQKIAKYIGNALET